LIDHQEVSISGTIGHVALSLDELRQLIADGRRIAEVYGLSATTLDGEPAQLVESSELASESSDNPTL
jgi:hypothetical protein